MIRFLIQIVLSLRQTQSTTKSKKKQRKSNDSLCSVGLHRGSAVFLCYLIHTQRERVRERERERELLCFCVA